MKKVLLFLLSFLYVNNNVVLAEELNINEYKQVLTQCYNNFEHNEKRCSDWNSRCFNHLQAEQEKLQKCYQKVAVSIFTEFYDLSNEDALQKFDNYKNFLQIEYKFIYSDSTYCKKNNCGIAPNLYSEYATSQGLYNYINKTINYIENQ